MEFLNKHSNILRPIYLVTIVLCLAVTANCIYAFLDDQHNELMLMSMTLNFVATLNMLIIAAALTLDKRKTMHNDLQIFLFFMSSLLLMFDSLTGFLEGRKEAAGLNYLSYVLKNLLLVLTCAFYTKYLFESINLPADKARPRYILANVAVVLGVVMLAINAFTGIIFSIDDAGCVARGELRFVYLLIYMILGSVTVIASIQYDEDRRERLVAAIMLASGWTVFFLDDTVKDLSPIYLVPALILIISFSNNYIYRSEVLSRKEVVIAKKNTELADLKFNAMVTQMQPHFLYNALTSIVNIKGNPPETREAIIDFASYLRTNLNTINNPYPIPFSKELDHIETYLSLEKLRFKDKLEIVWHINDRRFVIPALTAQTMVENAVRHGVSKRENGGRVIIVSEAVEDGHMIKVIDNGVGYDPNGPAPNDGRSHIGITSARERLKTMCNGTLTVKSTPGVGTTVTIFIPEPENQSNDAKSPPPLSQKTLPEEVNSEDE